MAGHVIMENKAFAGVNWYGCSVTVNFTASYKNKLKNLGTVDKWREFASTHFNIDEEIHDDNDAKFIVKLNVPFHGQGVIEAYGIENADKITVDRVKKAFIKILEKQLKFPLVKYYDVIDYDEWLDGKVPARVKAT